MKGTRVERISELWGKDGVDGGFCKMESVAGGEPTWFARTPNGHIGRLDNHDVTEHEDGTITVSPKIKLQGILWEGFLEQGFWREA